MTKAVAALTGGHTFVPTGNFPEFSRSNSKRARPFALRPLLNRKAIEAQIETLIDLLDRFDGDPDLEPDHEDFDACDLFEGGDHTSEALEYGSDQSAGPINVKGYVPKTGPNFAHLFGVAA